VVEIVTGLLFEARRKRAPNDDVTSVSTDRHAAAPVNRRSTTRIAAIFGGVVGYVRQWPFAG
jgi:hypothetical protein